MEAKQLDNGIDDTFVSSYRERARMIIDARNRATGEGKGAFETMIDASVQTDASTLTDVD